MKLSILICTLESRKQYLERLLERLSPQMVDGVEVNISSDNGSKTIGKKRNELLQGAKGEYLCFIDDDDLVSNNYVSYILEGINRGVDCCSLKGHYYVDCKFDGVFEHSILYDQYKTTDGPVKYERYPNHLNCIKSSIAKQFKFPEKNHGEDTDWATQIYKSKLIISQYNIPEVIYHYLYTSKK